VGACVTSSGGNFMDSLSALLTPALLNEAIKRNDVAVSEWVHPLPAMVHLLQELSVPAKVWVATPSLQGDETHARTIHFPVLHWAGWFWSEYRLQWIEGETPILRERQNRFAFLRKHNAYGDIPVAVGWSFGESGAMESPFSLWWESRVWAEGVLRHVPALLEKACLDQLPGAGAPSFVSRARL
jgi:hypothetical protein